MMSERFRGQLNFQLEVEPGIESVTVPRLLLQPIVENAFPPWAGGRARHALRERAASGKALALHRE